MDNKKILIIHLSRLGDMVQSLPAVKLLKEDNPGCTITCLGIEEFCSILVNVPWIDNLVTLPWREISPIMGEFNKAGVNELDRLWETIPELNQEYDMVINLTHNWVSSYLSEKVEAGEKRGRLLSENNEIIVSGRWGKYLFSMVKNQVDNLLNLIDIYMGVVGVKHMEGPLPILKEVHEYYMAETEVCDFPKLAHQFLDKFTVLKDIITSFETTLQKMEVSFA